MKTRDYYEQLQRELKDEAQAAAYLDAALEDGDPQVFLLALRNVALAQGGIQSLARKTHLHRVNLNRMLSDKGNPELNSLSTIFRKMGFRLRVETIKRKAAPRVKRTRTVVSPKQTVAV